MSVYAVQKELYLAAPQPGFAVYAHGQSYTSADGPGLIEAVRYEAKAITEEFGQRYHAPELYRRSSDDNGATWRVCGEVQREDPDHLGGFHLFTPSHFRDPDNGLLLSLQLGYEVSREQPKVETFSDEGLTNRSHRPFYAISYDRGATWSPLRQLIACGEEYDEEHWGPGLHYGENGGGSDLTAFQKLADGALALATTVNLQDGRRYQTVLLRGRWREDLSDLDWEFSEYIFVPATQSTQGCCEPSLLSLPDGRLLMGLRCCGDREGGAFPSLKFWTVSADEGSTWSGPRPLTYEDGSPVWSPSSYHALLTSAKNGRAYFLGNILPEPTYSSYPRHPLAIAEFDTERLCLLRDSVGIIQALPPGAPERRRYTNFGCYEERPTGDLILTLPEQPKISWEDFTADCYRYRVVLPD